jgi:TonB family protein
LAIAAMTFAATTAGAAGTQQQPATNATAPGVALLDKFDLFFQQAATNGAVGNDSIQPFFGELMQTARQALADQKISQPFFDRYTRVLRVMLLASIPDKAQILAPVTNREFASFIRDVTGKNLDDAKTVSLGDFSGAVAVEIGNLRKLTNGGVASGVVSGMPSAPTAPLRISGDIKPPERTKYVTPEYPSAARAAKVQGTVIIEAIIGKDGHVVSARALRPVPMLDEAAVAAVKQWEYTPTTVGGVPVEIVMTVTVSFNLK